MRIGDAALVLRGCPRDGDGHAIGGPQSRAALAFDAGDVNLYRYVKNDPTRTVDPLGLALTVYGPALVLSPGERVPVRVHLGDYLAAPSGSRISGGTDLWIINLETQVLGPAIVGMEKGGVVVVPKNDLAIVPTDSRFGGSREVDGPVTVLLPIGGKVEIPDGKSAFVPCESELVRPAVPFAQAPEDGTSAEASFNPNMIGD
jgi:hypothetical protein